MVDTNTYLERNIGRKEEMNAALKERRKVLFDCFVMEIIHSESVGWIERVGRGTVSGKDLCSCRN